MSIAVGLLEAVHENYCSRVVLLDTTAYAESGPVETQQPVATDTYPLGIKSVDYAEEIAEVYSVAGNFDLVAIVRVRENDDLARLVTAKLVAVEGIEETETLFAFKAYSRHDLDSLFSVGM